MRKFPVTVALEFSTYEQADKKAKDENRSLSSTINNIVMDYFAKEKKIG